MVRRADDDLRSCGQRIPARGLSARVGGPRGSAGVGPDDLYWPVYRTPAIIAYNSAAVPRDSAPQDWDDVLQPRWRDKVLIRDPVASGTMRAIWGLMIQRQARFPGDTAPGMAWLRRLDGQTRAYTLNPSVLDQKLARREGLVTLWDLPDILISIGKGMPFGYVFPPERDGGDRRCGGPGPRQPAPRRGPPVHRLCRQPGGAAAHGRQGFPPACPAGPPVGSVPDWVAEVERTMVVAPVDWAQLAAEGASVDGLLGPARTRYRAEIGRDPLQSPADPGRGGSRMTYLQLTGLTKRFGSTHAVGRPQRLPSRRVKSSPCWVRAAAARPRRCGSSWDSRHRTQGG